MVDFFNNREPKLYDGPIDIRLVPGIRTKTTIKSVHVSIDPEYFRADLAEVIKNNTHGELNHKQQTNLLHAVFSVLDRYSFKLDLPLEE